MNADSQTHGKKKDFWNEFQNWISLNYLYIDDYNQKIIPLNPNYSSILSSIPEMFTDILNMEGRKQD
jgi:hypothetical protein